MRQKISALESQKIDQDKLHEELGKANKEIKYLQKKLQEEFSEDMEVRCFTDELRQLLKDAISLRTENLSLKKYRIKAEKIKREILMTILNTAKCRGIDPAVFLEHILDILAKDKNADISKMLSIQPELAQEDAA